MTVQPLQSARTSKNPGQRSRIVLRDVPMDALIGVYDWEQLEPQPIRLNLEFSLPDDRAGSTDRLGDTVDYAAVIERLRQLAVERPHQLVESMAQTMADTLVREFKLGRLVLALVKTAPVPGAEVGVVVERGMEDVCACGRRQCP